MSSKSEIAATRYGPHIWERNDGPARFVDYPYSCFRRRWFLRRAALPLFWRGPQSSAGYHPSGPFGQALMAVAAYCGSEAPHRSRGERQVAERIHRRSTYAKLRRPKPKEKRFPILQLLSKITQGPNRRRAS